MMNRAIETLKNGHFTCVLRKDDNILTSTERGVKPLLNWIDSGVDLHGFVAADRVIGKGAAFLYVLMGVSAVHGQVISQSAIEVLSRYHIDVTYDISVPAIQNRDKTGFCPIETAVLSVDTPEQALPLIRTTLARLIGK